MTLQPLATEGTGSDMGFSNRNFTVSLKQKTQIMKKKWLRFSNRNFTVPNLIGKGTRLKVKGLIPFQMGIA